MPFKSKAQRRFMFGAAASGELDKKVLQHFREATPKGAKLPERVGEKQSAAASSLRIDDPELAATVAKLAAFAGTLNAGPVASFPGQGTLPSLPPVPLAQSYAPTQNPLGTIQNQSPQQLNYPPQVATAKRAEAPVFINLDAEDVIEALDHATFEPPAMSKLAAVLSPALEAYFGRKQTSEVPNVNKDTSLDPNSPHGQSQPDPMPIAGGATQQLQAGLPMGGQELQTQSVAAIQAQQGRAPGAPGAPAGQTPTGPAMGGVAGPAGNPIDRLGPIGGSGMSGLASMQHMMKGAKDAYHATENHPGMANLLSALGFRLDQQGDLIRLDVPSPTVKAAARPGIADPSESHRACPEASYPGHDSPRLASLMKAAQDSCAHVGMPQGEGTGPMVRSMAGEGRELANETVAKKLQPDETPQASGNHSAAWPAPPVGPKEATASYGYCPTCGAEGMTRERRRDGNDTCASGCTYPSNSAVMEKAASVGPALGKLLQGAVQAGQQKQSKLKPLSVEDILRQKKYEQRLRKQQARRGDLDAMAASVPG